MFSKGDRIIIQTPGGGGYGDPNQAPDREYATRAAHPVVKASGSLGAYKEMSEST